MPADIPAKDIWIQSDCWLDVGIPPLFPVFAGRICSRAGEHGRETGGSGLTGTSVRDMHPKVAWSIPFAFWLPTGNITI